LLLTFDFEKISNELCFANKYSMDKPFPQATNRFGTNELFKSTITKPDDVKFMPNRDMVTKRPLLMMNSANNKEKKPGVLDDKAKAKAEILMSLTSNMAQSSPTLSNIVLKTNKKTDQELLAELVIFLLNFERFLGKKLEFR
jgi:hypothetical protein